MSSTTLSQMLPTPHTSDENFLSPLSTTAIVGAPANFMETNAVIPPPIPNRRTLLAQQKSTSLELSRHNLKEGIERHRLTLTKAENDFLYDLRDCGDEAAIQQALKTLQDESLFPLFKYEIPDFALKPQKVDSSQNVLPGTLQADVEREISSFTDTTEESLSMLPAIVTCPNTTAVASGLTSSHICVGNTQVITPPSSSVGTERRKALIETRKKESVIFDKMWKAHENGLFVSINASRRSLMVRQTSLHEMSRRDMMNRSDSSQRYLMNRSDSSQRYLMNRSDSSQRFMSDLSDVSIQTGSGNLRHHYRRNESTSGLPLPSGFGMGTDSSIKNDDMGINRKNFYRINSSNGIRHSLLSKQQSGVGLLSRNLIWRRQGLNDNRMDSNRKINSGGVRMQRSLSVTAVDRSQSPQQPEIKLPTQHNALTHTPILPFPHPKQLKRILSDSTRKSVTFGDLPAPRDDTFCQAIQEVVALSRYDFDSPTNSFVDPPSIHLAHPLRSQSFRSQSSLDTRGQLEGDQDEKKEADSNSEDTEQVLIPTQVKCFSRPVIMRAASNITYDEEGIEIADFINEHIREREEHRQHPIPFQKARRMDSLLSNGDSVGSFPLIMCNSFDECLSVGRISSIFRKPIRRSLSDDNLNDIMLSRSKQLLQDTSLRDLVLTDDSGSWQFDVDGDDEVEDYHDPWKVVENDYDNGYGGGVTSTFKILGTSADDAKSHPHVLSPPLMESLLSFVPWSEHGNNFWMKYSLVRDGASLHSFLQCARGSKYSFLAIETVDGEVFGAFTSEPWRKNWNYFGGYESFLWRLRHSRRTKCTSVIDQAQKESEIDVYPFTGANDNVQLCTSDKIAVGGGMEIPMHITLDENMNEHEWGFGLTIQSDWIHGTSSPCLTFCSPSLSREHPDGSVFEIINLELWTLTPCTSVEQAEKMEVSKLFLEAHRSERNVKL